MQNYIIVRVLDEANYVLKTNKPVRAVSKHFGVSKSTVHKDLHERLRYVDGELFRQIQVILKNNFDCKHLRGGQSTKNKYKRLH